MPDWPYLSHGGAHGLGSPGLRGLKGQAWHATPPGLKLDGKGGGGPCWLPVQAACALQGRAACANG